MTINRRTFLLGVGTSAIALATSPYIIKAQSMGDAQYLVASLSSKVAYRSIYDIHFSGMEETVKIDQGRQWTFSRNGTPLKMIGINCRASYRWASLDQEGEIKVHYKDIFSVTVEPICPETIVSLTIMSNIEAVKTAERKCISETFRWRGTKLEESAICALDPKYDYLV